jgi:hypothetical protein
MSSFVIAAQKINVDCMLGEMKLDSREPKDQMRLENNTMIAVQNISV